MQSFKEKKECRYCYSSGESQSLIVPCKCEGTMKYVHSECLAEWIKNRRSNNALSEYLVSPRVYQARCEICKFEMRYIKQYKLSHIQSLLKMLKSLFSSTRNITFLILHSVVICLVYKRIKVFMYDMISIFKDLYPKRFFLLMHNLTIFISMVLGLNDIFLFYNKLYNQKRDCVFKFLSSVE